MFQVYCLLVRSPAAFLRSSLTRQVPLSMSNQSWLAECYADMLPPAGSVFVSEFPLRGLQDIC